MYYSPDGEVIVHVGGVEGARGKWFPSCEGRLQVVMSGGRNANTWRTFTPNSVDPVEDANQEYIATGMDYELAGIKEKKAAKRAKRHAGDHPPLIGKNP